MREGLDDAVPAFLDLLRGGNTGKMIVRLAGRRLIAGPARGRSSGMWLFFTRRLRMWLILTVLVPLATGLLRRVGRTLERRQRPDPRQPGPARGR